MDCGFVLQLEPLVPPVAKPAGPGLAIVALLRAIRRPDRLECVPTGNFDWRDRAAIRRQNRSELRVLFTEGPLAEQGADLLEWQEACDAGYEDSPVPLSLLAASMNSEFPRAS
jgi:hypothetical protein